MVRDDRFLARMRMRVRERLWLSMCHRTRRSLDRRRRICAHCHETLSLWPRGRSHRATTWITSWWRVGIRERDRALKFLTCKARRLLGGNGHDDRRCVRSRHWLVVVAQSQGAMVSFDDISHIQGSPPATRVASLTMDKKRAGASDGGDAKRIKSEPVWRQMAQRRAAGPVAPGSKAIPEGKPHCLAGLTLVFTGELSSISRDDAVD